MSTPVPGAPLVAASPSATAPTAPTARAPQIGWPSASQQAWQWSVDQFNVAYAAVLDQKQFEQWPDFFVPQGFYQVQSRENFERQWPLALLALEGQGMLRDRVYGITQTIYHAPYTMRHVLSPARLTLPQPDAPAEQQAVVRAETAFAVFRNRPSQVSEVYSVGRYLDEFVATGEGLRLQSRRCIVDGDTVLNSLIYPL